MITSNHRGHGHCLAKGLAPEPMMAELLARATGTNKGLGGSMHIADPDLGIFGANGIVAAGVPIAGGAALAAQLRGRGGQDGQRGVVVSFFGDGAVAQGAFHEAANLAALWRLPMVFFCENNGYAEFSPIADQHPVPMAARAAGYGLEYVSVDGNDVEAVAVAMSDAVRRIRDGRRAGVRGGRHLPLARALRGRPGEVPQQGRAVGVAAARSPGHHPRAAARPRRRAGRARPGRGAGAGQDRGRRRRRAAGAAAGHGRAPLVGVRAAAARRRARLAAVT